MTTELAEERRVYEAPARPPSGWPWERSQAFRAGTCRVRRFPGRGGVAVVRTALLRQLMPVGRVVASFGGRA